MSKTISSEHKKVVEFFHRNADVFNYQGQLGSMKYAFTEIAEALDARMRSEHPRDLRRTEKQLDYDAEIGDTMFMLLASIGIHEDSTSIFYENLRQYLGRENPNAIELHGDFSEEVSSGVDNAISRAAENIASALRDYPDSLTFAMKLSNALGSFDWRGDRLDRTIEKLQERCNTRRMSRQPEEIG